MNLNYFELLVIQKSWDYYFLKAPALHIRQHCMYLLALSFLHKLKWLTWSIQGNYSAFFKHDALVNSVDAQEQVAIY